MRSPDVPGIRAAIGRHPRVVDAGLAAVVAGVNIPSTATIGTGVVGWLWFVATHLPLVWRRRAPCVVFWAGCGLALAPPVIDVGVEGLFQFVVPLIAIYAIARYRPQRDLWTAVVTMEIIVLLVSVHDDLGWDEIIGTTAVLAATVLLAMNVRARRARLAELEQRAQRLERERDQQAQLAMAAERARIAREMHDIVAHNLAVMVALAEGAAFSATTAPQRAGDAMTKVAATGRDALDEMRRLLGVLHKDQSPDTAAALTPPPGFDDIDSLVDQVRATGLRVALTREGVAGGRNTGAGLAVYRIVQEALTNTIKHAGPQASAEVRLSYTNTGVDLEIIDDGGRQSGRPMTDPDTPGHGVTGMIERAATYGGHVEAGPCPGAGWRVRARLRFDDGEVSR